VFLVTRRADFEKLMDFRLSEAKSLLAEGKWDGAYYLAGYAVEFAFKVRIIAQLMASESFPDKKLIDDFYKHNLMELRKTAGLELVMQQDDTVAAQWNIVKDWSEQTRYQIGKTEADAVSLVNAIESEVLPWIKARW